MPSMRERIEAEPSYKRLFEWHENRIFGEIVVTNRALDFVAKWIAINVVQTPLWLLAFYVGHRLGWLLFH